MIGNSGITGFVSAGGGGGGGTPDFSTPYHFVFKGDNDSFYDTEATYESAARKTVDTSLIKEYIQEDGIFVYKHSLNTDGFIEEFLVSGVLQRYMNLTKYSGDANEDFSFSLGAGVVNMAMNMFVGDGDGIIVIGDVANSDFTLPQISFNMVTKEMRIKTGNILMIINATLDTIHVEGLQEFASNTAAAGSMGVNNLYKVTQPIAGDPQVLAITY